MKALRFILFVIVSLIVIGLIDFALIQMIKWTVGMTIQWRQQWNIIFFVVLAPLVWGVVWGMFKFTAMGLATLLIPVAPDRKYSLYFLMSLILVNCVGMLFIYWNGNMQYSTKEVVSLIIISLFILDFSVTTLLVFSRKQRPELEEY